MANSNKFNFSLPENPRKEINDAAAKLGLDKADIVRTGGYILAKLINEGLIEKAMLEYIIKEGEKK